MLIAQAAVYSGKIRYGTLLARPRRLGNRTTTAVWINLLDLGIANTLTNQISRSYALGDREAARQYFTNALVLTCSATALTAAMFAVLFGISTGSVFSM